MPSTPTYLEDTDGSPRNVFLGARLSRRSSWTNHVRLEQGALEKDVVIT